MTDQPESKPDLRRREFIRAAAAGTAVAALGGITLFIVSRDEEERARVLLRPDGGPRLPPGQRLVKPVNETFDAASETPGAREPLPADASAPLIDESAPRFIDGRPVDRPRVPPGQNTRSTLKPMGGQQGDSSRSRFQLRVHGEVERPLTLSFDELLDEPQVKLVCDVHCVTGWSLLDSRWQGVALAHLARKAGVKPSARHVIFEAAHGYTANVPLAEALAPNVIIAHRFEDKPLAPPHGAPARNIVPDLYFWKSAKWLTGVRFVARDEPGFWETRGYHNHADPWKEERHSAR